MQKKIKSASLIAAMLFLVACSMLSLSSPAPAATDTETALGASTPTVEAKPPTVEAHTPTDEAHTPTAAGPPIQYLNPKRYRIENVAVVTNGGYTLTELKVYQPKPVEWDGQEEVAIEEVLPSSAVTGREASSGTEMYYWHLANTPARGKDLILSYRFTFTAYEIRTFLDPDSVGAYDKQGSNWREYAKPEFLVESDDPEIMALASQIAAGEKNPYRLAEKYFDFTVDNLDYRIEGNTVPGAKAVLKSGGGDCGDFSALFIALARAGGIPARAVVGAWAISGEQYHVWAEFYLEGIGWIPVDPTVAQTKPNAFGVAKYYFGNMDNRRVIFSKGFNIKLDPPAPDGLIAPILQTPYWWYWGTTGDPESVTLDTEWKVTPI